MRKLLLFIVICFLAYGKISLDENSLEVLKENPNLNQIISEYKDLTIKEIIKDDLDNDGSTEFIISIYKENVDVSTFIKAIIVGSEKNKIIKYGEILIGSEKESDRKKVRSKNIFETASKKIYTVIITLKSITHYC